MGTGAVRVFIMSPDECIRRELGAMRGVRVEGFSAEAPLSLSPPGGSTVTAWILDERSCQGRSPAVFQNLWERAPVALLYRGDLPAGTVPGAPCFRWPEERDRLLEWMAGRAPDAGDPAPPGRPGRVPAVVGVLGPRGGVGKTLISGNLAASAALAGWETLLVDLDLHLPSAHIHLGVEAGDGIVSILPYLDDPPEQAWERSVAVHGPTGLRVLAGPPNPEMADLVDESQLRRLLDLCRSRYRAIVVDLPSGLAADLMWECIGVVDQVVAVTRPDPQSVGALRAFLDLTARLGLDMPAVRLVVNGVHPAAPLGRDECCRYLGLGPAAALPLEPRIVGESLAAGRPVVLNGDGDVLASAFRELAHSVWGVDGPQRRNGAGFLSQVVGRVRGWLR